MDYDIKRYKNSSGTVGFRALSNLITLYRDVVLAKIDSPQPCSLAQFDVEARGKDCADYEKAVSAELAEARFHETAMDLKRGIHKVLEKITVSSEYRKAIDQSITMIDSDRIRPIDERTRLIENILTQVKGLENQIDFNSPETLKKIKDKFLLKFSHYKTNGNNDLYVEHSSFLNQVLKKLMGKDSKNKPFLIKKASPNADTGSISEIAETLGVPVCQIDTTQDMGSMVNPDWYKFKSELINGMTILHHPAYHTVRLPSGQQLMTNNFQYDSTLGAYAIRQEGYTILLKKEENGTLDTKIYNKEEISKPPQLDLTWWKKCQETASSNPGQPLIVLNFPKDTKIDEIETILKKSSQLIQNKLYTSVDGTASIDPSQFTLLVSIENQESMSEIQKRFGDGLEKLSVNTLPITVRDPYARVMANQLLKDIDPTGQLTLDKLPEKEVDLLQRIIDYDRYQAKQYQGNISTVPLRMVLRDVWLPRVKGRTDDILGIQEADANIQGRYHSMVEIYNSLGFGPKKSDKDKPAVNQILDRLTRRVLKLKQSAQMDPIASNLLLETGNQSVKSFLDWRRDRHTGVLRYIIGESLVASRRKKSEERQKSDIEEKRRLEQEQMERGHIKKEEESRLKKLRTKANLEEEKDTEKNEKTTLE